MYEYYIQWLFLADRKEVETMDRVPQLWKVSPSGPLDILDAAVHQQVIDGCSDKEQLSRPHL